MVGWQGDKYTFLSNKIISHGEYFFLSGTVVLLSGAGQKKRWKSFSEYIC